VTGSIGFRPARRRRPQPFDWEVLDGAAERAGPEAGPEAGALDVGRAAVAAEVVVLAEPAPSAAGPAVVAVAGARGGCGRTTVAALLAATLAAGRPGQVGAVDAVPAVGDLGARLGASQVPVVVGGPPERWAAGELAVVDCPAGVGLLGAILGQAGQLVVVLAPDRVSAAPDLRLLDWLDVNGHDRLLRRAVVVRAAGRPDALDAHLAQRCLAVVRLPRDGHLAAGGPLDLRALGPGAGRARVSLAAAVEAALGTPAAPAEPDPVVQELLAAFQLAAMTVPGYLGAGAQAPAEGRRAWRLALTFEGPEPLAAWLASPARAGCHEAARRHGGFAARTVADVVDLG